MTSRHSTAIWGAIYFSRDLLADPDDTTMKAINILASQLYNINVGA